MLHRTSTNANPSTMSPSKSRSTRMHVIRPALLASMLTVQSALAQGVGESFPTALDDYVASAVRLWELPGAALAIVKDGRVLVVKGYGVREVGKPEAVDANTIFDIASLTKSFTAAAIGSLVDERKMSWDDPVHRFLPQVEFPDPHMNANVTLRDLLLHRTGLAATNSPAFAAYLSQPELLRLVKKMEIVAPFRARWLYSNVGYTMAGAAGAVAAGTSWEQLVTDRMLVPLGMTRTTADFTAAPRMGNVAVGHALFGGVQRRVPRDGSPRTNTAPAGAVQSSATDLAKWMLFHLGDGTYGGKRILSSDVMQEMHAPQVFVPTTAAFRESRQLKYFAGYGFGWQVFDYRGRQMIWHSGNGDGQVAYMALLPESSLGVAVVVNSWKAGGQLNRALAARIIDSYLGLPTRDYVAEWRREWITNAQRQADDERALAASRQQGTAPSLKLTEYSGTFTDRLGLTWTVRFENDTLRMRYAQGDVATLTHWHHDTFRARWSNPLRADDGERPLFVTFSVSAGATAERLLMDPGPFREAVIARRDTR